MMDNYEKTIDLMHLFNYLKYNLNKIIKVTMVVAIVTTLLLVAKNVIMPSEKMYYSTTKILFKFNSWSTTEKDYYLEDWNLNGTESYKSDTNWNFLDNAKYVFTSDRIITKIMDQFSIDEELDKFKEHIIVNQISGTQMIIVVVQAETPELAKNILNIVVESGMESVKNLYDLKFEKIDEYTECEKTFNTLKIDSQGKIETSTNIMDNIKLIVFAIGGTLALMIFYYCLKCELNNSVDSVEMIELGFGVPVLQVLGKDSKNYDIVSTKLINSDVKSVLFTSIKKDDLIGEDIVLIAKKLVDRNKKVLILCVDSKESIKIVSVSNFDTEIQTVDGIDFVSSCINEYNETLNKYMKDYDFVLIESSSMDENSDSLLISKLADYTVLVSKCNTISVNTYNQKINDFKRYSTGVDGVLLKDVDKYSISYKYIHVNSRDK